MKWKLIWLFFFIFTNVLFSVHTVEAKQRYLYKGEQHVFFHGIPALIKFNEGTRNKPIVIFIPGDANLARVAYGYPGDNRKDFLSYWFHKYGFSFLSISYPLGNPVFKKKYPNFTIRDWGNQAMYIANKIIKKNHLSKNIVVLAWSMGGIISESISEAAHKYSLKIELFVALAATPPLPQLILHQEKTIKETSDGLADRVSIRAQQFLNFIHQENKLNHHVIIPDNIYLSQLMGNTPVDIINTAIRYNAGKFTYSPEENIKDSGAFQYQNYPFIAVIHGNLETDPQHALVDKSTWLMLDSQMIYRQCLSLRKKNISVGDWKKLYLLVNSLQNKLVRIVPGNHFFFLGKMGAKKTTLEIIELRKIALKTQDKIQVYCKNRQ